MREHTLVVTRFFAMKKILFLILLIPSLAFAQGGLGNKPRTDIVMLSQVTRDSLSDVVFSHIMDLKRFAELNNVDSAAPLIAWKDTSKQWLRAVNLANPAERAYVADLLTKINKLFHDFPDTRRDYYTVFKTKDTPSGQKHIYQIVHLNGKKQRRMSWIFYPIGDQLLLGDF
jgi:hypothetical protein